MKLAAMKIAHLLIATVVGLTAVNAAVGEQLSRPVDDLAWVNGGPGLDFALVWGDWTQGAYGMIVRIEAGRAAPRHSHSEDYHGVTIQGNWVHTYGESDERTLAPGSYAFQAGGEVHGDRCEGTVDCLILIHQHGPRDFLLPNG